MHAWMNACMNEWTETNQTKLGFPINVNKPQVSYLKKKTRDILYFTEE